jgi:hypothetical protein
MKTILKTVGSISALGMVAALPIAGFHIHQSIGWLMVAVSCYACGQAAFTTSKEIEDKENVNTQK